MKKNKKQGPVLLFEQWSNRDSNKLNESNEVLTDTQKAIQDQLLENTGKHFLDSGGESGRAWQQRQESGLDFNEGLEIITDDDGVVTEVFIPIHVFMNQHLKRTEEAIQIEQQLLERLKEVLPEDDYVDLSYGHSEEINEILEDIGANPPDASEDFVWDYTYNFEHDLSGDIQFGVFNKNNKDYIIVETHNGADARGGFSEGKVYEIPEGWHDFLVNIMLNFEDSEGVPYDHGTYEVLDSDKYTLKYDETEGKFIDEKTGLTFKVLNF